MTALLIADLLEAVGIRGGLVIAIATAVSLLHVRSAAKRASAVGSTVLIGVYAIAILFVTSLFVPGLELDLALGQFVEFLDALVDALWRSVRGLL